jgi:hypothetical protein
LAQPNSPKAITPTSTEQTTMRGIVANLLSIFFSPHRASTDAHHVEARGTIPAGSGGTNANLQAQ